MNIYMYIVYMYTYDAHNLHRHFIFSYIENVCTLNTHNLSYLLSHTCTPSLPTTHIHTQGEKGMVGPQGEKGVMGDVGDKGMMVSNSTDNKGNHFTWNLPLAIWEVDA